jgi:hypothetical protein
MQVTKGLLQLHCPLCYGEHPCTTSEISRARRLHFRLDGLDPLATEATSVKKPLALAIAAAMAAMVLLPAARPAQADTTSTVIIAAAAAAIVGSLFTDSNNQPYYVSNGRHVYVNKSTANYYRAHGNSHRRGPQRDGPGGGQRR